ncbi:LPS assembly protein LptD [Sphingomonas sp. MG17]|uniref:LPS-assembly protein LptD n=1 Tax=Sphingomonas tagetis TaxID=2949092 RepID=A0A9X2HIN6_9SPHN|nr:LPS assembly protein LptD [Sphingomonas tagetis]MCP3730697.1 LPS assembly protein LptD [Sphingomonas tagetis]
MLSLALCLAPGAIAAGAAPQDLQDRAIEPPPPSETPLPDDPDQIQFSADTAEYDSDGDVVTVKGDVRMFRDGNRLRAAQVVWNRKTGAVVATGDIAVTNPEGDTAYGDRIELTDSLKDGVIENMLVVLEQGGRIAAQRGTRNAAGVISVDRAAYTPCAVVDSNNCPKEPSWKITAVRVVYDPAKQRIRYTGARVSLFGFATLPLPVFSHSVGAGNASGLLAPDIRYDAVNGFEVALPYFFALGPNRDLTIKPHIFSDTLPMLQGEYRQLLGKGAFRVTGYATFSSRADDFISPQPGVPDRSEFRGYLDATGRFQFDPYWQASASFRLASDRTFLRRYDISTDDRLRNNIRVERIDRDSYLAINGWAVQTLRLTESQGLQPIALPEVDYRRRFGQNLLPGGRFELQVNSLALTRTAGQDTQRAFASLRYDLRKLTSWGQELTLTAYGRGDLYNTNDTLATSVPSYRGLEGFRARAIGAVALDIKWPLIGEAFGGIQRITPRFQIVAAPRVENLDVPNEDARSVDLEDSNLFALNRFPGYDRFEDSTRFTFGLDYALYLPGFSVEANIGQSYRLSSRPSLLPDGTGLTDRVSDVVGRTVVRYRDFLTFNHRYRVDKDNLAIRRNELDATIGSRTTYATIGYLRLNRNIAFALEDLQDREEARVGGRVQVARFWSVFGSAVIDLTDREEDPASLNSGFEPVRHRIGVEYEDDCLRLGLTWKRDYQTAGDARRGNSYLLTLALKNLGR